MHRRIVCKDGRGVCSSSRIRNKLTNEQHANHDSKYIRETNLEGVRVRKGRQERGDVVRGRLGPLLKRRLHPGLALQIVGSDMDAKKHFKPYPSHGAFSSLYPLTSPSRSTIPLCGLAWIG